MIIDFDLFINNKITELWRPALTKAMIILTNAASPENLLILSALLALFFVLKKKNFQALFVLFAMAGGAVLHLFLKFIIMRPRPENSLIAETDFSLPSGHATMATIFFSLIIFLFKDKIENKILKKFFIAINIILILSIGFSRIYLNVHWLSDVLTGFALGLIIFYISVLIFKKYLTNL